MGGFIVAGCLVGAGIAFLVVWLAPAQPDLPDAIGRLDPARNNLATPGPAGTTDALARLGGWLRRRGMAADRVRIPAADLRLLSIPTSRFLGEKAAYAAIGLLFPTIFTAIIAAAGIRLPIAAPAVGGLVLGTLLWLVPDLDVRRRAADAREEFSRAVAAYIDLTAMERRSSGGATQSMEAAADVAGSWVFQRLRDELGRARWSGQPPWDALGSLGAELRVPALADLGDIMRMGGEEGVAVGEALQARAASARDAVLAADQTRANRANEALVMPVAALGMVFLAMLATPALLRIAFG